MQQRLFYIPDDLSLTLQNNTCNIIKLIPVQYDNYMKFSIITAHLLITEFQSIQFLLLLAFIYDIPHLHFHNVIRCLVIPLYAANLPVAI